MPVLPNAKHETFAQGIVRGLSGRDAYKAAGYAPANDETADAAASRLLRHDKVDARVKEILGKAAVESGVTAAQVLAELAKIAFADIRKVVSWRPELELAGEGSEEELEGGEGAKVLRSRVTVIDSAEIDDVTAAAISEVSQGANGTLRVKLHDKPSALEKIGRALGMFEHTGKLELTGKDGKDLVPEDRSELEVGRRLAFVLEMIARGEVKAKLPDPSK